GKLENGREIAVKRLSRDSGQGDQEFKNEVLFVARLQHRNLVRLLGFSIQGPERLLVYEFVHNGSLDHFIFDRARAVHLDWESRYKIIGGVARGVLYLHEDSRLRIIHRDLKASNVLLNEEMNAKISDFGLAKLVEPDATQESTTRIVGTYGYMAPEYAYHGHFSIKSDVYSFGVLVLETISGQKSVFIQDGNNSWNLLSYAWKSWGEGSSANIIDPILMANGGGSLHDMVRCIHIGLLCVQENPDDRPAMASVVTMLNSVSVTLPRPTQPGFYSMSGGFSQVVPLSNESRSSKTLLADQSVQFSGNDSDITHMHPR
ncbi:cysteine-rich RLK protein 10, partial [Perilla frutescens var. hirtella]